MNKQTRRKFTPEFKAKVALEAIRNRYTMVELSKKFDVSPVVVSKWKGEFLDNISAVFEKDHSKKQEDGLGCPGKQDNGQVAVVGGLSSGNHYCPVDVELFMPKSWETDHQRREKAGIPGHIRHRSKPEMALDMILDLRSRGISFDYVGFDALYGSSSALIGELDNAAIPFIGDVRDNIGVYLSEPGFSVPSAQKGKRGKKPKLPKADRPTVPLRKYMETLQTEEFTETAFRDGTKQKIKGTFPSKGSLGRNR